MNVVALAVLTEDEVATTLVLGFETLALAVGFGAWMVWLSSSEARVQDARTLAFLHPVVTMVSRVAIVCGFAVLVVVAAAAAVFWTVAAWPFAAAAGVLLAAFAVWWVRSAGQRNPFDEPDDETE